MGEHWTVALAKGIEHSDVPVALVVLQLDDDHQVSWANLVYSRDTLFLATE